MNLSAQFKEYLVSLDSPPSKVTIKNYVADISKFIRWTENEFGNNFEISESNSSLIDSFKEDSLKDYSASSVERSLSSLRKFFHFIKMEGKIVHSPFEQIANSAQALAKEDPWRLKDFKNHLYVFNASHLTIKNYIIDVKQFLNWAQEVLKDSQSWQLSQGEIFSKINSGLIEEYKERLLDENRLSPVSVNRKLSSLRKYMSWATEEGLLSEKPEVSNFQFPIYNQSSNETIEQSSQDHKSYSSFPPRRLIQKTINGTVGLFDSLFIYPMAALLDKSDEAFWSLRGRPVFKDSLRKQLKIPSFKTFEPKIISNIPKSFYAPALISTKNFPLHRKIWHHARNTRPNWYKKYHSYAFVSYLHFSILMLFISILGYVAFDYFKPERQPATLAALPSAPPRVLSFQGRLTDASDNPITTQTSLRMAIYNNLTASGSSLLWQEVVSPTPDQDGIFNVILGKNTVIPQSLFAQNSGLWLGVTVERTSELTPRQQIATVAFASNAETLQGLPPITNTTATSNVVLALNSSGNLSIGGTASPTFQATGGTFTLSGKTLLLTTTLASNGNVAIVPNGTGIIDLQKPLQNTTNNNSLVPGSVEVNDLFVVNGSSTTQAILNIAQGSTGDLIIASTGGATKFRVDNGGNVTSGGSFNGLGISSGTITSGTWNATAISSTYGGTGLNTSSSTGVPFISSGTWSIDPDYLGANHGGTGQTSYSTGDILYATSSSGLARLAVGTSSQCLTGGTSPVWGSCTSGTSGAWWSQTGGLLYPDNSTVDFLIGGQSSASAKFAVLNVDSGTPTASISASSGDNAIYLTGGGNLQTTNRQTLTIGGGTTGNITLSPLNSGSGARVEPGADNTVSLGSSPSARFKDIFLGSGSVHIQCTTGDGCGQGLDYALGVNTSTGTFSIGVNGTTSVGNPLLNITQGGNVGIGTTTPAQGIDIEKTAGATVGKFGASLPIYLIAPSPNVGFNAYYNSGFKFGKGSVSGSHYAGTMTLEPSTGAWAFYTSNATGNADAAVTMVSLLSISQIGNVAITGDLAITGGNITSAVTADSTLTVAGTFDPNGAITLPTTGISGAGSGSGLDADLLDGIDSSRIVYGDNANKTRNVADINTALASGFYDTNAGTGAPTATWYNIITSRHNNVANQYEMQIAGNFFNNTDFYVRNINNGVATAWAKIWNDANDGSGSGLDADLWDGNNFATYLNQAVLTTSSPTFAGLSLGGVLAIDHSSATYDVWIVGKNGAGEDRNLALLGVESTDDLILNYNTEYDCVSIGGTSCSNALDVSGTVGATSFSGAGTGLTGTAGSLTAGAVPYSGITSLPAFAANAVSGRVRMFEVGCEGSWASSCDANTNGRVDTADLATTATTATTANAVSFNNGLTTSSNATFSSLNIGTLTVTAANVFMAIGNSGFNNRSVCHRTDTNEIDSINAACSTSSLRFKHDIADLDYGIDELMQLRPVSFVYNDFDPNNPDGRTEHRIGFIAEEMNEIIPEVVYKDKNGLIYTIDYPNLTALNTRGIQQQQLQIMDSRNRIASIEADLSFNNNGNLSLAPDVDGNFEVKRNTGETVARIGAFSDLVVANIKAGYLEVGRITVELLNVTSVYASEITTNSLAVATDNITIAGVGIRDYIYSIVNDAISNSQFSISNENLNAQNIKTNIISPLSDESNLALKFENNKLSIVNGKSATAAAVAVFDAEGNASFSGKVRSQELEVSSDASISGTLRASRIVADQLELSEEALLSLLGLEESSTSATYITNNYYSTPSASPFDYDPNASSSANGQWLMANGQSATGSARFDNLFAKTATFEQGLMSFGPTSFFEASIADRLFVGAQLSIADNAINVLGSNLQIQPLRQGGVSFVAGLVEIDKDGNLKVDGNAYFAKDLEVKGSLLANIISPLADQDLVFELGSKNKEPGSEQNHDSSFIIHNSSRAGVLSINNKGDLNASGAGTFNKLNLSVVGEALAVSDIEVIATGSAGTAQIKPNRTELTIRNPLVTKDSLIYVTPKTSVPNQNVYLIRQVSGESFTVGLSQSINKKVPFNWILIN